MAFRGIDSAYLLLLGVCVGAMVACGMMSAPIIFRAGEILSMPISVEQSGILMGLIFQKLSILLYIVGIIIFVFELFAARLFRTSGVLVMLSAGVSIMMILLFNLYYMPYILNVTDTQASEFESMHAQSVIVFKILVVSLATLFVAKSFKLFKS
ncbi:DUF4149 domain-containing protein [Helicobacter equorum]|uniref:DUF4149 domain-containing protein n=1 Tax=Helicobacter equorum TaxID=361872 RepID=A0A3D8ISN4_9HELI|nr:DUF4149 domain-containing protein [Helicobacter equorum]MCI6312744.1 DUF4149 domain-containing protein [Helicobacter sp.]MCI7711277.1 DUF4149 domain-containing protein [Helicobacter sp.]MDD7346460.1 DUF4149 domain-containing protein [Helicobacter sp.]MDY2824141.1 DUF4149 domain-containing protein [Helicobacter sp.]RDU68000.1 DUF4149 domain-containing protein [Helicobacter equorum]